MRPRQRRDTSAGCHGRQTVNRTRRPALKQAEIDGQTTEADAELRRDGGGAERGGEGRGGTAREGTSASL